MTAFYDSRVMATRGVTEAPVVQPAVAVQTLPVGSPGPSRYGLAPSRVLTSPQSQAVSTRPAKTIGYTTYKDLEKSSGAGGAALRQSSGTFYNSRVIAAPGVTPGPAPIIQPAAAVVMTLQDLQDPIDFEMLEEQKEVTLDTNVVVDEAVNVALEVPTIEQQSEVALDMNAVVEAELDQSMDESERVLATTVIEEDETMASVQENIERAVLEKVLESSLELLEGVECEDFYPEIEASYEMAEDVVGHLGVVREDTPSEVSAEETPSEDVSEVGPTKPSGVTTCWQGCFEWLPSRRQ